MERLIVGIEGMSCQGCVKSMTEVLRALPGVLEANVSLENAEARIDYDPERVQPDRFREAIEEAGFVARPS